MRVICTLVLAASLALSLTACAGGGDRAATTADMGQLQTVMLAADETLAENITSVTGDVSDAKDLFAYFSDMDYDKVDNFLLSYSTSGKADEIAVIAVKDVADVGEALNSLNEHLQNRLKLFETYDPDEAARVEKAEVFTQDQYAVLLICDGSDAVKSAFQDFLSGQS